MLDEKLIAKYMATLNIGREDAIQLVEDDKEIDRGAKMFELDPELEKGAKKARQAERKVSTTTKRTRKPNEDKATLVNALFSAVLPMCETYEVTNSEREFLFTYKGTKYKVTLACPRS